MAEADNITRLVLAELRCAYLRAKSAELEIQQISELLKMGACNAGEALVAIEQLGFGGVLGAEMRQLVETSKPKGARSANAK